MIRFSVLGMALLLGLGSPASAREAKLVRYPDFHDGKVAFTYLGDIWLADADGKNVQRLTVHKARDVYPRFSPDGRWIAFSSDREGNMDVYVIPTAGGAVRRLTVHSADETTAGLDSRRQGRSSSPASGARTSWASSTWSRSMGACRGTRAPTWGSPARIRPMAPSWPSTARRRPTGASTTAAPTRATSR